MTSSVNGSGNKNGRIAPKQTAGKNKSSTGSKPADAFKPAEITDNSLVVLKKRYLQKNDKGDLAETPEGMFRRVADALAEPDGRKYGRSPAQVRSVADEFYRAMASLEYLPNSPTLMNAGTGAGTLSACFVLPLKDSMEGIMGAAHDAAMVQKFGGGTGFALSEIRPKGASIKTTHGKACGPIAVLRHLSSVSTLVTQGGKRDGANMAVMDVHHPDIEEFISCKSVEGQIHNFNISVGASDEFMSAVAAGIDFALKEPRSGKEIGRKNARDLFNKIVQGAWRNGEPGMIFLDEVNRNSPVLHVGRITATNPCGEQPLLPNESCNLGSIDLSKFVTGGYATSAVKREALAPAGAGGRSKTSATATAALPGLDWDRLGRMVRLTVHFLDNVIDANKYAVPAIEDMTNHTRKIGLGVMGFADMLVELGIPYDSEAGIETGRNLMRFIQQEADAASQDLARERGPYPAWEGGAPQKQGETPMRNACRLTVAPTGTISMIAGCSSGIEPIFSLAFRKQNILEGQTLYYVDRNFERIARERGFYSEELMAYLSDGGSLLDRDDVPQDVRRLFHVASDISPENHVLMQAGFQESTDAGISKTINFPNSATVEDVENAYMLAWKTRCKGITVYRAGSREKEVLATGHAKGKSTDGTKAEATTTVSGAPDAGSAGQAEGFDKLSLHVETEEAGDGFGGFVPQYVTPKDRPEMIQGVTRRMRTGHGNMYITINVDQHGQPFEVFATAGKSGSCDSALTEAVTRLMSLSLRSGIDPEDIVRQLRGITCHPNWDQGAVINSGPDAIAIALDRQLEARTKPAGKMESGEHGQLAMLERPSAKELGRPTATAVPVIQSPSGVTGRTAQKVTIAAGMGFANLCPDCSGTLAHEEGCQKCHNCGYSKC
ncbi:MAG: adenosylcobalamin-dependent ribonucleoside-diphosphate reductase [Dehalococcoidia bacterium]|nr:adenosylcobalamin-dependent ribonucleoside-diphosphate reductase [Dehalococcoidia bacterium]